MPDEESRIGEDQTRRQRGDTGDGFRTSILVLDGVVGDFNFAVRALGHPQKSLNTLVSPRTAMTTSEFPMVVCL